MKSMTAAVGLVTIEITHHHGALTQAVTAEGVDVITLVWHGHGKFDGLLGAFLSDNFIQGS